MSAPPIPPVEPYFCPNCGLSLRELVEFCPACGARIEPKSFKLRYFAGIAFLAVFTLGFGASGACTMVAAVTGVKDLPELRPMLITAGSVLLIAAAVCLRGLILLMKRNK